MIDHRISFLLLFFLKITITTIVKEPIRSLHLEQLLKSKSNILHDRWQRALNSRQAARVLRRLCDWRRQSHLSSALCKFYFLPMPSYSFLSKASRFSVRTVDCTGAFGWLRQLGLHADARSPRASARTRAGGRRVIVIGSSAKGSRFDAWDRKRLFFF